MADEVLLMEARLKEHITGELSKIEAGLKKTDEAGKRTFTNVQSHADSAGAAVGKLSSSYNLATIATQRLIAVAGGLALFNQATRFLNESSRAASDQAMSEAKLSSALGYTSKALIDYADNLQKTTTFSDDSIIAAQSLIASHIKDESAIKRVTKAAVDLAAAKGMDLSSAADLLTRSIVSSTNALSRQGIQIEGAAASEARLESAINGVARAYGGRAEAIANTDHGKIQQLNNLLNNTQEKIGKDILPLQVEWNKTVLSLVETFSGPLAGALKGISTALSGPNAQEVAAKGKANELAFLEEQQRKYQEIVKQQSANQAAGPFTILGGMFDPKALSEAEQKLRVIAKQIETIQGVQGSGGGGGPEQTLQEKIKQGERAYQILKQQMLDYAQADFEAQEAMYNAYKTRIEKEVQADYERIERKKQLEADALDKVASTTGTEGLELQALTAKFEAELAMYEEAGASIDNVVRRHEAERTAIEARHSEQRKKIAEQEKQMKISAGFQVAQGFGQSLQMIGQATKANAQTQKRISQIQAIINTAEAATKANTATPYPPINAVLMGLAIAQGLAQVAIIEQQKFARGGIVNGPTTPVDSVNARLTGGEMVLNKEQQAQLFRMANGSSTTNNNANVNLTINTGGGSYDMSAAQYTVDALKPIIGKVLLEAKNEGRLIDYEMAR